MLKNIKALVVFNKENSCMKVQKLRVSLLLILMSLLYFNLFVLIVYGFKSVSNKDFWLMVVKLIKIIKTNQLTLFKWSRF